MSNFYSESVAGLTKLESRNRDRSYGGAHFVGVGINIGREIQFKAI